MTLLEIIQAASGELGLPIPTQIINASGTAAIQARQMLALVNSAGRALVRVHDWGDLIKPATITTVAGQTDYPVETDYQRMVSETSWDRSTLLPLYGPTTPQSDRARREGRIQGIGINRIFRQVGHTFIGIWPTPTTSGDVLSYEYVSKNWAAGTNGELAAMAADADITIFDGDLLVKDVKWRFMSAKGMDISIFLPEWRTMLDQLIASDIGGRTLNMGPCEERDGFNVVAGQQPNFILGEGGDYIEWD